MLYEVITDYVLAVRDGPGGSVETFRLDAQGSAGA